MCQNNTKCSSKMLLFLMPALAQQDCANRWVPLKRLHLPKSPAGGGGAGKGMLPIQKTGLLVLLETSCLSSQGLCIWLSSELRKKHFLMLLMMPKATLR